VSRITFKKALQTLDRDGVVERIVGKGSFVAAQLPALERLPSPEAALRSRRVRRSCIGFVLPAFSPAFEIGLLEGVEARTAELGLNLIVRRTHGRQNVEEQVIDSLMSSELVDGLIVFAVNGDYYNRSLLRLVLERAPLVLADRALNGIAACAVTTEHGEPRGSPRRAPGDHGTVLVHEVLASLGRLDGRTIACFDMPDLPFAPHDFLHVRQDERAMGRLAVDLLVAQVDDDAVPPVSTVPYVIVDPTTDR